MKTMTAREQKVVILVLGFLAGIGVEGFETGDKERLEEMMQALGTILERLDG